MWSLQPGSGKSFMIASLAFLLQKSGGKVRLLFPNRFLKEQNQKSFKRLIGEDANVTYHDLVTDQQALKEIGNPETDILLVDEADLLFNNYVNVDGKHILHLWKNYVGFTGTLPL
jgi:superfamily II DNA or RNA helicase